ncbi:Transcription factor [Basidiobolus ranarum]|uniref:Transcription factor n=1 Tax=Basidiobolus ranarum TaxID=34480 RepID=A0ABR2X2J8_9FUNG
MTTTVPYVKAENSDYQLPYISSFIQSRNPFTSQVSSVSDYPSFSTEVETTETNGLESSDLIAPKKLDLEPNPFEQSFLASSAPSNSNITASSRNTGLLPPVSSIENPRGDGPDWNQSLRAGPLSPSMLFGPQPNIAKTVMNSQPFPMGSNIYDNPSGQSNTANFSGISSSYYRRPSDESSRPVVTGWAEPLGIDSKNIPGSNKRKSSDCSRSDWSVDSDMSRRNSIDDADSMKYKSDMTPDEKRKLFLERNRKAALKCRQRKKQWLSNLQEKVDYLSQENDSLQDQATSLREEIINLKTLLLAHKECPVAQANGVIGLDNLAPTLGDHTLVMGQTAGQEMAAFPAASRSGIPSNSVGLAPNTIIRF